MAFLNEHSLASVEIQPFAADASFRRYFRLVGTTPAMLLMDAPPAQEKIDPFVLLARHLQHIGLRTPTIYGSDEVNGFVLLEDFGDDTFTRLLQASSSTSRFSEVELYQLATDVLISLHHHPKAQAVAVADYDIETLVNESALFSEWYLASVNGTETDSDCTAQWRDAWRNCLRRLPTLSSTLVLRDFHVDNLMIVDSARDRPDNEAVDSNRCGLLDFQDAVIGSPAYDFVSLLEDARRDVAENVREHLKNYYSEHCLLIKDATAAQRFWRHYRVLGAQRHAKVAGIFVRLAARDGKDNYLDHLPRVLRLFQKSISASTDEYDDFVEIRQWLGQNFETYRNHTNDQTQARFPIPASTSLHFQNSKNRN